MGRRRRHKTSSKKRVKKSFSRRAKERPLWKKFLFWIPVYAVFFLFLFLVFQGSKIYEAKIGFYLLSGFILTLISRIIYSAVYKKSFRGKDLVLWGLIYSVAFGLIHFLLMKISILAELNIYLFAIIFSLIFSLVIIFLRRIKFDSRRKKSKFSRAPSQIISGIILLFSGLLTFRFSHEIFVGWFSSYELMGWSWLVGIGLILGGILTLIAWWRNNVLTHNIGLKFGKI